MINIAMISYHTCPLATLGGKDTGGMNVYVRDLTRHLGPLNVHVDVFTRSQDEHVPHVLHDLGYGNRVVHIPAGPEHPLSKEQMATYIPEFVEGIKQFAAEKNIHYDLIHSHYWMSGIAALELRKVWHIPVVHMFHTLVLMKNSVAQSAAELEGNYRLEGEQRILREADCIIAATPAEENQLKTLYQADTSRLTVIPPGVDISRFYPIPADEAKAFVGTPPYERMILFVGRIEPLKGVETLIRALAQMRHSGVTCQLPHYLTVIGGDPSVDKRKMTAEMARLQRLCCELGVSDLVLFLGKRDQDILPYYYSAAELLVMPSHYESFGLVALESMACGTPVVASRVGGLAFLIQDGINGYSVPDGDVNALSERITFLLQNPRQRTALGQNANAYAQDYAWEKIARRISNLYHKLLTPATVAVE
ncbi:MAG: glycosyltransferase [Anaerolineae bacterium]|nr:glycosyltransferase [Anaerolineae bacterium]